jgi:hypothetical protein
MGPKGTNSSSATSHMRDVRDLLMKRHGPEDMGDAAPKANAMANLDSRLLGKRHFDAPNFKELLKAAAPFSLPGAQTVLQGHLVSGNMTHKLGDDTSVLPAWRTAYTHLIGYNVPGVVNADALRTLAADSGAYANEAFPLEPNWKTSFWGVHYPKLSAIKSKYDPKGLLYVSPGINADLYEARDGRICKRTTPYTANTAPPSDNPNRGRTMKGSINNKVVGMMSE